MMNREDIDRDGREIDGKRLYIEGRRSRK